MLRAASCCCRCCRRLRRRRRRRRCRCCCYCCYSCCCLVLFVVVVVIFVVGTFCKPPKKSSNRLFLQIPKSIKKHQIGGVFGIFHVLGTKKHRKYRGFASKNHGIYSVLWPGPSKNTGIYAVSSMLSEAFFWMPKAQKHCK